MATHPSTARPVGPLGQPITRFECSRCERHWAVYDGCTPRGWLVLGARVLCDRCRRREARGDAERAR